MFSYADHKTIIGRVVFTASFHVSVASHRWVISSKLVNRIFYNPCIQVWVRA